MPLIRKIISAGQNSRAVVLPSTWLRYHEQRLVRKIESVLITVNDQLTIIPEGLNE